MGEDTTIQAITEEQHSKQSAKPAKDASKKYPYYKIVVWVLRILVGATFIFSGFVKCIDPWGFIFKIEEYLQVWGIHWLWRETVLTIAVVLSTLEFCGGFALLTGSLRRTVSWCLLLFMAVMLPLTAYIAIAQPVTDCGCFGDALIISDNATFLKNLFLTACIIYLLKYNQRVPGIYPPLSQIWPMILSGIYCLIICAIGITIQPLIDFRQFKVGTQLIDDPSGSVQMIYEKDGHTQTFDINALPDSTWTFVGRDVLSDSESSHSLAIYDGDDEVTDQVLQPEGKQMLLIVPDAEIHNKARASMANNVNDYITSQGGEMIGLIGTSPQGLELWKEIAKPHFDVYTSDETTLKELVRGDAGLVYLVDGKVVWKRNMFSLFGDFPDFNKDDQLDSLYVIDSGQFIKNLTGMYAAALLILYLLGLIRIRRKHNKENMPKNP